MYFFNEATPNPGSDEAIKLGCTCAVLDNSHGNQKLGDTRGFWISGGCPLHAATPAAIDIRKQLMGLELSVDVPEGITVSGGPLTLGGLISARDIDALVQLFTEAMETVISPDENAINLNYYGDAFKAQNSRNRLRAEQRQRLAEMVGYSASEKPAPQEEVSGKQADNRCAICERPATTKYEGIESCGRPSCEYQIQEGIDAIRDIGAK